MKNVLSQGFFFLFIIVCLFVGGSSIAFADNHAPVLDAGRSPTMVTVAATTSAPVGAVGTPVSFFVDFATPAGQVDNVTDVDSAALLGIAITAQDASLTCYSSMDGGTNWSPFASVPSTSAALLFSANSVNRIYCRSNAGGTVPALTFRAWDQTSGVDGGTADVSSSGGTTAFSSASDTIDLTVTGGVINNAPVLDASKTPVMNDITEDSGVPVGAVGTTVTRLIDDASSPGGLDNAIDADEGTVLGVAIVGTNSSLTCYYSIDSGTNWSLVGAVSGASARLLVATPTDRVYCRGNANANGTFVAALTFRAWDQTVGVDGGLTNASVTGDPTAYSAATDTTDLTITPVNDAPVLDPTRTPTMNAILEDAVAPVGAVGTQVLSLVDFAPPAGGLDNVDDHFDSGALTGIAITATNSDLTCYYSVNSGTDWSLIGEVSDASALLLAADVSTNRVYCNGGLNANGTIDDALTIRAWDQTTDTDGTLADVSSNGGSTAYSSVSDTVSLPITAVNDAPSATNLSAPETYTQNHALNLTDIVPDDVDNSTVTVTLTLSNPSAGTLNTTSIGPYTSTYNPSTGVWSVTGVIPYVITILQGLTFTPALNVHSSFTIATLVSDGALSVSGSKAVTGSLDTTAPTVVSVSPTNAATTVLVDSHVVITFSEIMNPASFVASTTPCNLGEGSASCATYTPVWSLGNTRVTLTLSNGPLQVGTAYTVSISTAADAAGNNLGDYSWSFTTIAPYVLTEVTPVPSIVSGSSAQYHYSSSGTGTAELIVTACGDAEISATEIGSEDEQVQFDNLQLGYTYQCTVKIRSTIGTGLYTNSNILHIGAFTRPTLTAASAGAILYGCTDPQALNYQHYATSKPDMCIYRTGSSSTSVATTTATTTVSSPPIVSNVSKFIFTKNLRQSMTDSDVLQLQKFLNRQGFIIALKGSGSVGNETTFFGPATKRALIKFQEAHAAAILIPQQLTQGTGIFGKGTRDFVNGL